MIFSQYKETSEVLLYYTRIGGGNIINDANKAIKNILHANIDVHSRILISELLG